MKLTHQDIARGVIQATGGTLNDHYKQLNSMFPFIRKSIFNDRKQTGVRYDLLVDGKQTSIIECTDSEAINYFDSLDGKKEPMPVMTIENYWHKYLTQSYING